MSMHGLCAGRGPNRVIVPELFYNRKHNCIYAFGAFGFSIRSTPALMGRLRSST
jgi:hypothetical protein